MVISLDAVSAYVHNDYIMRPTRSKRDQHNTLVASSIDQLPQQITATLASWPKVNPFAKKQFDAIVVCGMGGSALAADWLRYTYWNKLKLPIVIVNNYQLPASVTAKSLIVIASYSGTTEESLSCFQEARRKHLPIIVLTSGGPLAELAARHRLPHVIFNTQYNPSGQPRLGLGYFVAAYFQIARWTKALNVPTTELIAASKKLKPAAKLITTQAKQLATQQCIVIASEHLIGAAHIASNQLNETAKMFAAYFALPELNHHLLEGLSQLGARSKQWSVICLESSLYGSQTRKRYRVTQEILKRFGITVTKQSFTGSTLEQSLQAIAWSSAITLELAQQQYLDATAIPWVSYLKKRLA